MSRLQDEFICVLDKNTLTIKKCPDNILTYDLLKDILSKNDVTNVVICDGVETIKYMTFSNYGMLKKISLPNTLIRIEDNAFSNCEQLSEIIIPSNVKQIKYNAFSGCINLRKVNIPSGVETIEHNSFSNCKKLKHVYIEEGVKVIEAEAFGYCTSLRSIKLPSSIREIGESAFKKCYNLRKIIIPEGVEKLDYCFNCCEKLSKVTLPSTLKIITNNSFSHCPNLSKIKLPDNLEIIGYRSFEKTGLSRINIPGNVKKIGEYAFAYCVYLWDVKLNDGLNHIEKGAFAGCEEIRTIYLPNTVKKLEEEAFKNCYSLSKVMLSENINSINNEVFSSCHGLKKIEIPEGIKLVELGAFSKCYGLEEIHFPSTIKLFYKDEDTTSKPQKIFVQCKDGEKEIDITTKWFIKNNEGKLMMYDDETELYSFYNDGEYIEFNETFFDKNKRINKMIEQGQIDEKYYINLYYWSAKKIIPSPIVIKTMPINDIDKFFVNKNCNEWLMLVKQSGIKEVQNIASFFKLCYVLGVFSESTSLRDKAVNFIRENIITKLKGIDIHEKFDGFELENGFNKEYAEFFMKYYKNEDFMIMIDDNEEEVDLTASSYNNFKQVKKVYPNMTLHTNRKADLLLPEHVINAVGVTKYENVDEGNEEFAALVSKYGYSNNQFQILQEWYNKAKSIKARENKLFISKDDEEKGITYELLSKDDPRGAVLGNITNCCQVIGAAGEECVEYGLTKPNSGFITFNYKGKIIGQAWVWYDEKNKTICLDNIEVPHRYLEKINENKMIQDSFIKCLLRIKENLKKEMSINGFEVDKVTIGKGFNDIANILENKFETDREASKLSGYRGYSDAIRQYEIKNKRK